MNIIKHNLNVWFGPHLCLAVFCICFHLLCRFLYKPSFYLLANVIVLTSYRYNANVPYFTFCLLFLIQACIFVNMSFPDYHFICISTYPYVCGFKTCSEPLFGVIFLLMQFMMFYDRLLFCVFCIL